MLVIRLARTGRRNQPKFRVVVAEHSKPVNGRVVEIVGYYNPTVKKDPLTINKEAVEVWLSKGTQPSNTVSRLLNTYAGFNLDVKQNLPRKPRKEVAVKPEENLVDVSAEGEPVASEAPVESEPVKAETVAETPAEELVSAEAEEVAKETIKDEKSEPDPASDEAEPGK